MEISKLKQVEEICNKHFRCIVRPLDDHHAKGYKGIKLIVGTKRNPAYDASVDPSDPNLPIELKQNKELLKTKTNPEAPDVRILWLPPGTTEQELIDKWLLPIKKSMEQKKPIVKKDPTLTKLETESDADLAAKLASGENVDSRFDEWDDGYEEEDNNPEAAEKPMAELDKRDNPGDVGPKDNRVIEDDKVADNLAVLVENISVLSKDINLLNDNISKIETRVDGLEKRKTKKKK